jgi:DNA-binding GntR family transcriptional regulator
MGQEIDRRSEEWYYLQLARILRGQIEAGELEPGQALPSDMRLMQEYGLSRGTVRQALEILRDEGYVQTVKQRGSWVRPRGDWNPPAR